jgi:serine-type D-Ala-D-Ala carboxypeptidase/endopeptidase (penicillin-binding protein 4)
MAVLDNSTLPESVAKLMDTSGLQRDSLSVLVVPARGGAARLDVGSKRAMQPASTIKTLTSAAALDLLGPAWRGQVELRAAQAVSGPVFSGDLLLRGMNHPQFMRADLDALLAALRAAGVREWRGNLLIDRSANQPARPDVGVPPFDEAPEFQYNMIPDALSLGHNLIGVRMRSDTTTVALHLEPVLQGVNLKHEFALVDAKCADWESGWKIPRVEASADQSTVILHGSFPRYCTAAADINVLDRNAYVQAVVRTLWQQSGGAWDGRAVELPAGDARAAAFGQLVAQSSSNTLADVIRPVNKRSDNVITRIVFNALAATAAAPGSTTFARADGAVRGWLAKGGVDASGLVLENGSGLSRSERISAATLAGALQAAARGPWGSEFEASLPIVGTDGSMRNRLKTGPAFQRARIKTGGLRNVNSIAGYVLDTNGEKLVIVAFINQDPLPRRVGTPILDALIEWAAQSAEKGR